MTADADFIVNPESMQFESSCIMLAKLTRLAQQKIAAAQGNLRNKLLHRNFWKSLKVSARKERELAIQRNFFNLNGEEEDYDDMYHKAAVNKDVEPENNAVKILQPIADHKEANVETIYIQQAREQTTKLNNADEVSEKISEELSLPGMVQKDKNDMGHSTILSEMQKKPPAAGENYEANFEATKLPYRILTDVSAMTNILGNLLHGNKHAGTKNFFVFIERKLLKAAHVFSLFGYDIVFDLTICA